MRSVISILVAVSLALHALLGCCGHHAHANDKASETGQHGSSHACHDCPWHHDDAPAEQAPCQDHDTPCQEHDCSAAVVTVCDRTAHDVLAEFSGELSLVSLASNCQAPSFVELHALDELGPPQVPLFLRIQVLRN